MIKETGSVHAIVANKGRMLLQLRDDNPDILNPNCWGAIGGRVEGGETFVEGLIREVLEETCVRVSEEQCEFVMKKGYRDGEVFFINLDDNQAESVKLGNEGQEVRFFTLQEMDRLNNLSPILRNQVSASRALVKKCLKRSVSQ
ncbi:hypothetical protein A3A71_01345 [Candidatus Berkelbacteria bacterium RIFCSPLOWO2_01_FULL_50_28]|uniref:Nudix hydrolase domain-containing protein n=1 Tax=Candidatus Berkelbacteria bacterium RIFCSPLOWO2_01_FULL_50_28 TaxID=1797471 RepID=A0A1F5EB94_9BACT|nr:MAG: hypothetical protein A2807_01915 [Candidatus Berkelbacteria bacterium RIFCSPHIGHO2_01_FULL_50_36]OGD64007.1 MAG: hypothetical protein A3F39_02955 [Candidatus Berkelbacteria bacterium RIFCSPHIGHO2_12_FULL_50_11]OGD64682.1 MAG: hypothetical protein A3A71_01345 [Candidatus Berkelbacteria bacterium RIFCSPLOWO2_01_FULL_50_28]